MAARDCYSSYSLDKRFSGPKIITPTHNYLSGDWKSPCYTRASYYTPSERNWTKYHNYKNIPTGARRDAIDFQSEDKWVEFQRHRDAPRGDKLNPGGRYTYSPATSIVRESSPSLSICGDLPERLQFPTPATVAPRTTTLVLPLLLQHWYTHRTFRSHFHQVKVKTWSCKRGQTPVLHHRTLPSSIISFSP